MVVVTTFRDPGQIEQMIRIGMVEGMTEAMGEIDALLAG
jgi:hypothetical protein